MSDDFKPWVECSAVPMLHVYLHGSLEGPGKVFGLLPVWLHAMGVVFPVHNQKDDSGGGMGSYSFYCYPQDWPLIRDFLLSQGVDLAIPAERRRTCKECGKPFDAGLDGRRKRRLFCSDACKSRAYRRKSEEKQP